MPFLTLGLDATILKAVQEAGYTEPTPIQTAAIPQILAGHDLIGIAQTGTGKTAAFVLPILAKLAATSRRDGPRSIHALILAPTRELAAQIEENVRIYGKHLSVRAAIVYGGVSERPQIEALRSGVELLVATPGRLLDLMNRRLCDFSRLQFLVLDEAERMLDMGFLPDIRRIVKALPAKRQTLLFSATLSREIEAVTHEFLRAPKTVQIGRRANPAETVTQLAYEVPKHLKSNLLLHLLVDPSLNMVLVFSRMKHGADRIARHLEAKGIRTATLHSNRSQNQRLRALKDFKSGAVRVLVATDIAARGIDVDGISHVVNYDFPMHPEDYVHRIGRTGRAHAVGDALSFVTPEDHSALRSLERFIGRGIVRKRAEGFNYTAPAPVGAPRMPQGRQNAPGQAHAEPAGNRPHQGGFGRRQGSRSHSGGHRRWGR
jgi:ATP-dependent RNA helicase RhlE